MRIMEIKRVIGKFRVTAFMNARRRFAKTRNCMGKIVRFNNLPEWAKVVYILEHHWFGY